MAELDWPETIPGVMDFGAVSQGTVKTFPAPGHGVYLPYYPCVLLLAVPDTGDTAQVNIPPGTTQPKIAHDTSGQITTTPGNPGTVNIYKSGTDLVFEFNMAVPAFNALRIM
jgi:hypothetical protein